MTTQSTLARGWQHQQAGDLVNAETAYRAVLMAEPHNLDALYLLAALCDVQSRFDESIPLYREYLRLKPEVAEVHNSLGVAYALKGNPTEAQACYREASRLKPDYAEPLNNLGFLHTAASEFEQAIHTYEQALARAPRYPQALNNLGITLFKQRRVDEAIQRFQEALRIQPQYAEARNNLGNAFLAQDQLAEAGECFRQVLRWLPNDALTLNNLGGVYLKLKQWDHAAGYLQKSIATDPGDPQTHRNLGNVYFQLEKFDEALKCYENAHRLRPDDVEMKLMVEALRGTSTLTKMPAEFLSSLYDGLAHRFDEHLVHQLGYRSPELMQRELQPPPAPRSLDVLDLGCGTGLCGVQFKVWAKTLRGVDLSPRMLDKARERNVYDELIVGDLLVLLLDAKEKFDLILASHSYTSPTHRGTFMILRSRITCASAWRPLCSHATPVAARKGW